MIAVRPLPPRAVVVGKGRLGRALASALERSGASPSVVSGREASVRPDEVVSAARNSGPGVDLLLAVRDDALAGLVASLAAVASRLPAGTVAIHHSGARGADVLAPLGRLGLAIGSCHPLQTFAGSASDSERFEGIAFAVDGSGPGLAAAALLARALGGQPFAIASGKRPLYHLAAALGANGLTGLVAASRDALVGAGLAPGDALGALGPLLRSALEEALRMGPEGALTGPVARGDEATLELQRKALLAWDAGRAALHEALLREQRRLVHRRPGGTEC